MPTPSRPQPVRPAFGGTTTVVSFAAQHPGKRIRDVVADYAVLADRGALIDYAFHMIVADISGENLTHDIPALIADDHRSIKIFTTYDKVRLDDPSILSVLRPRRAALSGLLSRRERRPDPPSDRAAAGRGQDRAQVSCAVASPRGRDRGAGADVPVQRILRPADHAVPHLDPRGGTEIVRAARARGVPVVAETCPHYLFMTEDDLNLRRQPGGWPHL